MLATAPAPPAGQPGPSKGQQALDVAAGYVGTPFVWGDARSLE